MLKITIPAQEGWNEQLQEFINIKACSLLLEHSLLSLSKWESKWKKPFLANNEKTQEETLDYIRCMTLTQNVNSEVYYFVTDDNIKEITAYIEDTMTATTFGNNSKKTGRINGERITSELIYYWMVAFNIPFECQKWHLNRLITLIEICSRKQDKPKKMPKSSVYSQNSALNAARRAKANSKG